MAYSFDPIPPTDTIYRVGPDGNIAPYAFLWKQAELPPSTPEELDEFSKSLSKALSYFKS